MKSSKVFTTATVAAGMAFVLTACGAKAANPVEFYINPGEEITEVVKFKDANGEEQTQEQAYTSYEYLTLSKDGTYVMEQHRHQSMMDEFVYAVGTYTKEAANAKYQGYTEIKLAPATYINVESDIYHEMFTLSLNSETTTFPAEKAGGAQVSKAEFEATYGNFGSRFIVHVANIGATSTQNNIRTANGVQIVE